MARSVMDWIIVGLALFAATQGTWAMGPAAPFVPPNAQSTDPTVGVMQSPVTTGLTGVKLGRHPQALIDGQWAAPGDSVRTDSVLVSVGLRDVQLQRADGSIEQLTLLPGIEMKKARNQ